MTIDEHISQLKQFDFLRFLKLKEIWLKDITFEWLIQGHIKQQQAIELVEKAENAFKYNRIEKEDFQSARLVKMRDKTCYSFSEVSID